MRLDARLKHRFPALEKSAPLPESAFQLWSSLAAVPGEANVLPWNQPNPRADCPDPQCAARFEDALRHRLAILSAKPVDVSKSGPHSEAFMVSTAGLPREAVESYVHIDWHRDHHSGFRWDESEIYFSSRVAPRRGVDIKIPWELSKFLHIGVLAQGDLVKGGQEFLLQVLDWIDKNPRRTGVNWTSTLVVALRSINWIWGLRLFEPIVKRFPVPLRAIIGSIHEHGLHIEKNLDYYVDRTDDHYLGDIAGLIYIGAAFPDFPESDRWLLFGLQELLSEMKRQVLGDGYHHMMSVGYHRFAAELFATSAVMAERLPSERRRRLKSVDPRKHLVRPKLSGADRLPLNYGNSGRMLPGDFYATLGKMAEISVALTKPNGRVPQFGDNDSARAHRLLPGAADDSRDHRHLAALVGILTSRDDLCEAGRASEPEGKLIAGGLPSAGGHTAPRPPSNPRCFADSQIAVARSGAAFLAVTSSPVGMCGHGGHGHNDRLSFELNVGGHDLIVDGGCPVYTAYPEIRNRFRSTAAHNTIAIDGEEQNPWPEGLDGLFTLPERIRPRLEILDGGVISGEHFGYDAPHRRNFRLEDSSLILEDDLDVEKPRCLNFNLDPEVKVVRIEKAGSGFRCDMNHPSGLEFRLEIDRAQSANIVDGCFGSGYGIPIPNMKLSVRLSSRMTRTRISWRMG